MNKTATLIKDHMQGYRGYASLYELSHPVKDYDGNEHYFVIVSAADVMMSGPETYIFPADKDGEIVDWMELDGSFKGGLDHSAALLGAGYVIAEKEGE